MSSESSTASGNDNNNNKKRSRRTSSRSGSGGGGGSTTTSTSRKNPSNKKSKTNNKKDDDDDDNKNTTSRTTTSGKRVRKRCGSCEACRREDCGVCVECVRKIKFGGVGGSKQACVERRCVILEELKKERKRHRAAGLPVADYDGETDVWSEYDDVIIQSAAATTTTKKESKGSNKGKSTTTNKKTTTTKQQARRQRRPSATGGGSTGSSGNNNGAGGNAPQPPDDDDDDDDDNNNDAKKQEVEEKDPMVLQLEEAFPGPLPSLLATTQLEQRAIVAQKQQRRQMNRRLQPLEDYKYGIPVPNPVVEVCAGCRQIQAPSADGEGDDNNDNDDANDKEPVILLCDGPNCQSEYHLECCIPPISEVPAGNYYCVDCNPTGSSTILEQYLDDHDDRRAEELSSAIMHATSSASEANSTTTTTNTTTTTGSSSSSGNNNNATDKNHNIMIPFAFLFRLWKEDLEDNQDNWNDEKPNNNAATTTTSAAAAAAAAMDGEENDDDDDDQEDGIAVRRKKSKQQQQPPPQPPLQRIPQSELARLLDLQQQLTGSPPAHKPCTWVELCDLFLGKPLRLYCPLDDNYHSGRIVDYRPIPANLLHPTSSSTTTAMSLSSSLAASNSTTAGGASSGATGGATGGGISKKSSKQQQSKASSSQLLFPDPDAKIYHPSDNFFANGVEFLVRFLAGSQEYRKTHLYRWIRLEEHSLAVGTHLVWGKFHAPTPLISTTTNSSTASTSNNTSGSGSAKKSAPPAAAVTAHLGSPGGGGSGGGGVGAAWQPAILFLRTTRELMPVLHLLQEEEGEISYHPIALTHVMNNSIATSSVGGTTTTTTTASTGTTGKGKKSSSAAAAAVNWPPTVTTKKDPHKIWALAKRLGCSSAATSTTTSSGPDGDTTNGDKNNDEQNATPNGAAAAFAAAGGTSGSEAYKLLRISDEARDFFARNSGASHVEQLKHSLALAEFHEQQMVIHWKKNLPEEQKWTPNALRRRDEYTLGPVPFQTTNESVLCRSCSGVGMSKTAITTATPTTRDEQELCPLIRPPGLDRAYLMDRLVQRGNVDKATKDVAAGLECWLVPE